jgi:putative membrane protein
MLQNHHHPLLRVVIAMVVIAALAALVAFLVVRFANRRGRLQPMTAAPAGPPVHDAALEQLRLRYARGEVSRTDYLQAVADLGGRPPEPQPA